MSDEKTISAKEKLKSVFARIQDLELRGQILDLTDNMQDEEAEMILNKLEAIKSSELEIAALESQSCRLQNKLH